MNEISGRDGGTPKIRALRILPPLAIARLGSSDDPMDNYTIGRDVGPDEAEPLGYRRIVALQTPIVDPKSGEIVGMKPPGELAFKRDGRIRPIAPFLEVFAIVEEAGEERLVPLTRDLLEEAGFGVGSVTWTIDLVNRKAARRTGDVNDIVKTRGKVEINDHAVHELSGHCENFVSQETFIRFGSARFIRPNADYPQIRLRFTPGKGLIYGPPEPPESGSQADAVDDLYAPRKPYRIEPERAVYGESGIWDDYHDGSSPDDPPADPVAAARAALWQDKRDKRWDDNKWPRDFSNETIPPSLFAIDPPAPSWLFDNQAVGRGYLDDVCDGFVEVTIAGAPLQASARIVVGPPAVAPDSSFVRTLADDLDQAIFGPEVDPGEPPEVSRARALDIVRRAFETVRFMNVAVMNGNDVKGRSSLILDSMPQEEAADTERAIRPVMRPGTVDTRAIMALHQQVYAALLGGVAPWFSALLRQPDEAADFTDYGRRKMPALLCGSDNNYLALTWRQIRTIERAAKGSLIEPAPPAPAQQLTPRNLSAQMHYEAMGNPVASRPISAVGNCCPGLEVDFRAVWRRMLIGVELREYDNLVVHIDEDSDEATRASVAGLAGRRLLRIVLPEGAMAPKTRDGTVRRELPTSTPIKGPASSDPLGWILLTTANNPDGLAPLEWSNAFAYMTPLAGQRLRCDFTIEPSWDSQTALVEDDPESGRKRNYQSVELVVRRFFEPDSAVISRALAKAGELTQGLCSPWQNDYRECSCYYWASARPDFVNVEIDRDGLSMGDNWFQRDRTGAYVPDDYSDSRLVLYDELFHNWEAVLKFQYKGRDMPDDCIVPDASAAADGRSPESGGPDPETAPR